MIGTAASAPLLAGYEPRARGLAHRIALALVWITIAASGVVLSEPAPVDALMMGLMVMLPAMGFVAMRPALLGLLALWLVCAASAFFAASGAADLSGAAIHTTVSLYLYLATFVLAAFVARRPQAHAELLLNASLWAALVPTVTAMIGYFDLLPGAADLFTRYGRAAGTFKDPNVLGPFLVPALLYALHLALTRPALKAAIALAAAGFIGVAILLTFSRGAWFSLAAALAVYGYVTFVTAPTQRQRLRIVMLFAGGALLAALFAAAAMQVDAVSSLFEERASLNQSYDVGPEGRFGGQQKAIDVILDNPFGIGALQFAPAYHHEAAHNVYLTMPLNAGWIGGGLYWIIVGLTLFLGLRHLRVAGATRPLFLLAYAAFIGNVLEGAVIDTDHWRHFYVLMALVWGPMAAPVASVNLSQRLSVHIRPPAGEMRLKRLPRHFPEIFQRPLR